MADASGDPYTHLRTNAAAQKQTTVDRLRRAITQLEVEGRPVNTFTIKEVSGMDYMSYYRNREAFQLFQEHSTHLRKEREQEQAKRQAASRRGSRKTGKDQTAAHAVKISPRDPLLDYKRPRLVELLHEARAERDEAKRQLRTERVEADQRAQAERAKLAITNSYKSTRAVVSPLRNWKLRSPSTLPLWSASDPRFNGRSTAKSCNEHLNASREYLWGSGKLRKN